MSTIDTTTRPRASRLTRLTCMVMVLLLAAVGAAHVFAQSQADGGEGAAADANAAATETGAESDPSDQTMQQLMDQRQPPPTVAPTRADGEAPTGQVEIDRSVLGVAPGEEQPTLRREGEFIVNRRGRLRRSADGAHMLFVFEADDRQSLETPMILQPCQLLETMEDLVQQRGDGVTFIVSGQIYTYRGANYLLPTMMKIDVDPGGDTAPASDE